MATAKVTSPNILVKQPGESRTYVFDFNNFPELIPVEDGGAGETLDTQIAPQVTSEPPGLVIEDIGHVPPVAPATSTGQVNMRIKEGIDKTNYNVECTVQTSGENIIELDGTLKVRDTDT